MPELPEVETIAQGLSHVLVGRVLRKAEVLDPKLSRRVFVPLITKRVKSVFRSGKQVIVEFAGPRSALYLCIHLRMSGRLFWKPKGGHRTISSAETRHLRAALEFSGGELLFCDPRRFGTVAVVRDRAEFLPKGIEPLSPACSKKLCRELFGKSGQTVKEFLLRQDRLVGIGNIYASEILFAAEINPLRRACELSADEVERVRLATKRVLRQAVKHRGTTLSDFRDAQGSFGEHAKFLKVYQREGEPCRYCKAFIRRTVQAQRSSFYCPRCQR